MSDGEFDLAMLGIQFPRFENIKRVFEGDPALASRRHEREESKPSTLLPRDRAARRNK